MVRGLYDLRARENGGQSIHIYHADNIKDLGFAIIYQEPYESV